MFQVQWTQDDSSDLDNAVVLSQDDISGDYENTRFAVEHVEWVSALNISGDLEFDSMPPGPDGLVLSFPPDATSGELDFKDYPSGAIPDPNRLSPGNLVLTTRGSLPGDELFLTLKFREKGTKNA